MYASKNGDEVPRTGKKYIDWYGYILVGGLFTVIGFRAGHFLRPGVIGLQCTIML